MKIKILLSLILLSVGLSACSKLKAPEVQRIAYLDQGWNETQRNWYHFTTQGTKTLSVPVDWFMALEQPGIEIIGRPGMISDPNFLAGYGFFGMERNEYNPLGLPIGFAIDYDFEDPTTGEKYNALGYTCAACHTSQLIYNNVAVRVEGGSTNANIVTLILGIVEAMVAADSIPWRFERFAERVLREENTKENRKKLRKELLAKIKFFTKFAIENAIKHPETIKNGFGRVDALNLIGNQVFGTDARRPQNNAGLTAPVSYPMIWTSSWFRWVQYDGSVMQVMVRNTGEALGVMAPVNLTAHDSTKYTSAVKFQNIHDIEMMLAGDAPPMNLKKYKGLRAPKWPEEIFPAIDQKLATQGGVLYEEHCRSCHGYPVGSPEFAASPNWETTKGHEKYKFYRNPMIPLSVIGTDGGQAGILPTRTVDTSDGLLPDAKICLCTTDASINYKYSCTKVKYKGKKKALFALSLGLGVELTVNKWFDEQNFSQAKRDLYSAYSPNCLRAESSYRTRPLNGVWATPPFLHNGSVPTLYDLLSPVSERPNTYYSGSMVFDPKKVGYVTEKVSGSFEYKTNIKGNYNTGHEFNDGNKKGVIGPKLTEAERWAIIEYLKTI
ncbi:MAG: di-heme-cytochrome C peroxidase [Leptospirales bacterium]